MSVRKLISHELNLVSLTLLDEEDPKFFESLKIVREAHAKLGYGEDPLAVLIRQEEADDYCDFLP